VSATFTPTSSGKAHFPGSARSADFISCHGVCGDKINDLGAFIVGNPAFLGAA